VLNDVVEQARDATGATGAAIALLRDGEMVCRATTGDSAPDLGVRAETRAGLAAACLSTGQIQQCRDTETDPRVNAEACRRLGVRSMLIAPLIDEAQIFGILQVFSAWPNAFGEREISALRFLAQRIAENKKEAEAGSAAPAAVQDEPEQRMDPSPGPPSPLNDTADRVEPAARVEPDYVPFEEPPKPGRSDFWSAILVVLVIATAVLLGVVVGWRGAARVATSGSSPASTSPPAPGVAAAANPSSSQPASSQPNAPSSSPASVSPPDLKAAPANTPPSGSLIVTENGKVIYRQTPSGSTGATHSSPPRTGTWLIHRVEPEYPPEARAQNLQGSVVLVVQIHGDGSVGEIGIASGDPVLAKAAIQAVKQWRYQPYYVDGHAVESQTRITVKFTMPSA